MSFYQAPEEDPYSHIGRIKHDDVCFLATHTQRKRVEVYVSSDEEKYRVQHYPTIQERIHAQKDWTKTQLAEAKVAYEREALKKVMDDQVAKARREAATAIEGRDDTAVDGDDSLDELAVDDEYEQQEDTGGANQTDASYMQELVGIKERKLLATRNTSVYHAELSPYQARKLAFRLYMGWTGKRDKTLTVVLPWLLLGRRETSQSMPLLLKLGVTHILNVTHDQPNRFGNHFVYQRIAVKDSVEADLGSKFSAAIAFIKRVEDCKGRVCASGASSPSDPSNSPRFPTAACALHSGRLSRALGGPGLPGVREEVVAAGRVHIPYSPATPGLPEQAFPLPVGYAGGAVRRRMFGLLPPGLALLRVQHLPSRGRRTA